MSAGALHIDGITHRYGRVTALEGIDLTVAAGEFVALLGPSGCGKTTLLRTIGGFVRPSEGRVFLDGADITHAPPHRRPVNMVFQRPTLFPHLDVQGNVAFGLRLAGLGRRERDERVREALALVRLEGLDRRRNHELSGGQMQRVALARALVNRPRVLLLDEPLSALDLTIRLELEGELRRMHRETGATFAYVTHDQREALALADRVVVFDHGRVEQVGTPDEVYHRPTSPYVARFVGDANVLAVEVGADGVTRLAGRPVPSGNGLPAGPAWLVVRRENVRLVPAGDGLAGIVLDAAFRGTGHGLRIAVDAVDVPFGVELAGRTRPVDVGEAIAVTWRSEDTHLLRREPRP